MVTAPAHTGYFEVYRFRLYTAILSLKNPVYAAAWASAAAGTRLWTIRTRGGLPYHVFGVAPNDKGHTSDRLKC